MRTTHTINIPLSRGLSRRASRSSLTSTVSAICVGAICLSSTLSHAQDDNSVSIIEPEEQNRKVDTAQIDTERFELGAYLGLLSVQNFNTNPVYGLSFSFHITDRWMAQLNYASSDFDQSNAEASRGDNFSAIVDRDRNVEYVNLLAGYKLLDGRSFLSANKKFDSSFYVLAGVGETDFAEVSDTSFTFGFSYRVVLTDYLTANVDIKDHLIKQEIDEGETESTHNNELTFGINALF